ncbi:MAG: hypothetical protein E5Y31_23285 [Mesorhizobium sp.]|nr:MAG: hypothetical protein E5Y31_23285 [Mesorhizobium sp.]
MNTGNPHLCIPSGAATIALDEGVQNPCRKNHAWFDMPGYQFDMPGYRFDMPDYRPHDPGNASFRYSYAQKG